MTTGKRITQILSGFFLTLAVRVASGKKKAREQEQFAYAKLFREMFDARVGPKFWSLFNQLVSEVSFADQGNDRVRVGREIFLRAFIEKVSCDYLKSFSVIADRLGYAPDAEQFYREIFEDYSREANGEFLFNHPVAEDIPEGDIPRINTKKG